MKASAFIHPGDTREETLPNDAKGVGFLFRFALGTKNWPALGPVLRRETPTSKSPGALTPYAPGFIQFTAATSTKDQS